MPNITNSLQSLKLQTTNNFLFTTNIQVHEDFEKLHLNANNEITMS